MRKTYTPAAALIAEAANHAVQMVLEKDPARRSVNDLIEAANAWLDGLSYRAPTRQQMQVAISRIVTRLENAERFVTAHTRPPRYVSVSVLREVAAQVKADPEDEQARAHLAGMLGDLESALVHWQLQHAKAREKRVEISKLAQLPADLLNHQIDEQLTLFEPGEVGA